ncbi:MAG: CBS domain-containing protein, partial [Gemmatimonadetes bacterium]|nr:CBS domain-containing protein [Gemmatimonadota bacterium]
AQLMIRRGVRAVPVVGQDLEVLGVITGGDLLPHAVPGNGENEAGDRITARDVMTRSVLCVSEEQTLLEASRAMIGRDVGQLPVVREGEMIGFLDRVTVMKAFAEVVDMAPPRSGG